MVSTRPVAEILGLAQRPLKGTLRFVERLITGPWDERDFVTISRHTAVTID